MRMSEKCRNSNNSDDPLTSRRTEGGKKKNRTGLDWKVEKRSGGGYRAN